MYEGQIRSCCSEKGFAYGNDMLINDFNSTPPSLAVPENVNGHFTSASARLSTKVDSKKSMSIASNIMT